MVILLFSCPKLLNFFSQAQLNFFHHLIAETHLDEQEITRESHRLGRMHSTYAQFGLKAHFLDLFQLHLLNLLKNLKIDDAQEKAVMLAGWETLLGYIIECINFAYTQALCGFKSENMKCPMEE